MISLERKEFVQRLMEAGWTQGEAEAEWKRIQEEEEGD
jgi:hypothetical protein